MKADVKYNDFIGTAVAEMTDFLCIYLNQKCVYNDK